MLTELFLTMLLKLLYAMRAKIAIIFTGFAILHSACLFVSQCYVHMKQHCDIKMTLFLDLNTRARLFKTNDVVS